MSKDGTVRVHLSISLAFLLVDSLSLSIILSFSFSISPILSVPISNHIFQWSHLFLYFTFISYFVFVFDFHSLYPQVVIFLYNCPSYYASLFLLFSGCLYLKFLVSLFTFYFLFYFVFICLCQLVVYFPTSIYNLVCFCISTYTIFQYVVQANMCQITLLLLCTFVCD